MKMRLIVLVALLPIVASSQTKEAPLPYRVSPIAGDADKLARVHESVLLARLLEHREKTKKSVLEFTVISVLPGEGYLCSVADRTVLLRTSEKGHADGDTLELAVQGTGETYAYTSAIGAAKNVHVVEPIQRPAVFTMAEFIERLKEGETFLIQQGEREVRCPNCGGFGKGRMVDGRYVRCSCGDVGIWKEPNYYEVSW